ncbi:permease [Pleurocapsales cyanobacterium LEGE 06147]|nr:permease [Pleurocapsales cyanobacterium LEGE 06147]
MNQLHNAFTLFLSLLVEAIPFLLFGVLLSSSLIFLVDERQLITRLPKNPFLGAIVGSCIGFLFPVCECGNVPVARRLLLKGVSPSVAIAFLLAAPTINPVVIWSTWIAFGDRPQIVVLRVLFSLGISILIGCIFSVQKDLRPLLQATLAKRLNVLIGESTALSPESSRFGDAARRKPLAAGTWFRLRPSQRTQSSKTESIVPQQEEKVPVLLQSGTFLLNSSGTPSRLDSFLPETVSTFYASVSPVAKGWRFLDNVVQELRELGGMLIFGSAIAVIIQVFIPREFVLNLGQDTVTSILAMLVLAGIVSICSTVDAFFALSFASTFTSGSLLAFLVFGPMIDIKGIGLMLSVFKPRMIIYLFALAAQLTFIFTLSYSYFW